MLYSGMFPVTTVADREARPPGPALAEAAARFGAPVCVTAMTDATPPTPAPLWTTTSSSDPPPSLRGQIRTDHESQLPRATKEALPWISLDTTANIRPAAAREPGARQPHSPRPRWG